MHTGLAALLTGLSAVLLGLAFAPTSLHGLAWLGLAPFLMALRLVPAGRGLLLAYAWSVGFPYTVGDWMPRAIETYYLQPRLFGWVFYLAVVTSMMAPYVLLFAVAQRRLAARWRVALPLLVAAAWTGCELLRGRLFTGTPFFIGNPWALLGYSQVGWDAPVQIAAIAGVYGIGFALAAANAGLAELGLALAGRGMGRRPALLGAALALGPACIVLGYGALVLRGAPASDEDATGSGSVGVALVQANVTTGSHWRADYYGRNLETYLRLTLGALRDGAPAVVFWPESAMSFFLEDEPAYRRSIASVLEPADVELVAGGPRQEGDEAAPRFFNTLFAIGPDGGVRARYDKQYLVPFGEYFPWRSIDFLRRRFERVRVFEPGAGASLLPTRAGLAGVATCNEAMLPEVVGRRVAEGAEILLNPSNDVWIPDAGFAELQFDIVTLRAVEQRRWLLRPSTTGPSALVDPWGRVVARTSLDERKVLLGRVRPLRERTVYGHVGDLFAVLCAVAALAACWRATATRRTSASQRSGESVA